MQSSVYQVKHQYNHLDLRITSSRSTCLTVETWNVVLFMPLFEWGIRLRFDQWINMMFYNNIFHTNLTISIVVNLSLRNKHINSLNIVSLKHNNLARTDHVNKQQTNSQKHTNTLNTQQTNKPYPLKKTP